MSSRELRKCSGLSYLGLEDILATNVSISCQTLVNIKGFGYLDTNIGQDEDLPAGSMIQLPLWAAKALNFRSRQFISAEIPYIFGPEFGASFLADASSVNLRSFGPYYYRSGAACCILRDVMSSHVANILPELFAQRIRAFYDGSVYQHVTYSAVGNGKEKGSLNDSTFDEVEEKILFDTRKASFLLEKWLNC